MKHELNMLCNLLSVLTNFEADTSEHLVKKARKLSRGIDLIVMKLKPHVSRHLLDVYTRFKIRILKHVEKKSVKLFAGWELH